MEVFAPASLLLSGCSFKPLLLCLLGLPVPFKRPPPWESPLGCASAALPAECSQRCRWNAQLIRSNPRECVGGSSVGRTEQTLNSISALSLAGPRGPRRKCEGRKALGTWRASQLGGGRRSLRVALLLWTRPPRASKPSPRCGPGEAVPPLLPWDLSRTPPPGLPHSLISLGRAAQRGRGRAGVSQDSWLTASLGLGAGPRRPGGRWYRRCDSWSPDSSPSGASSGFGPGRRQGKGSWCQPGLGALLGRAGAGWEAVNSPVVGRQGCLRQPPCWALHWILTGRLTHGSTRHGRVNR